VALAAGAFELEEAEGAVPLLLALPFGLACAFGVDFAFAAAGNAGFAIAGLGSTSDDLRASNFLRSPLCGPILHSSSLVPKGAPGASEVSTARSQGENKQNKQNNTKQENQSTKQHNTHTT
jgi:hypothetical protein